MATYRVYHVDRQRRFTSAQYLDAPTDEAAVGEAEDLCEEGAPTIEVWQSTRLVEEIDCEEDA
jgi:hypothetical protein